MTTLKLGEIGQLVLEAKKLEKFEYRAIQRELKKKDVEPKKKKNKSPQDIKTPWYDYNRINHGGKNAD